MSNLDIKFKRLTPFKRCVLQNFPFIEADFDALTNYGLLCKIVKYLNQVIASQNEVQGVTEEIVTAFNNLSIVILLQGIFRSKINIAEHSQTNF